MDTKHTPGPWTLASSPETADGIRTPEGTWIDIDAKGHPGIARVVWRMEDDERSPEMEANAHAMAAAWALLAEIEREYTELADIHNDWPGRNTAAGQMKLARLRDLIAQATGRDPQEVQDDYSMRAAIAKATNTTPQAA